MDPFVKWWKSKILLKFNPNSFVSYQFVIFTTFSYKENKGEKTINRQYPIPCNTTTHLGFCDQF